MPLFVERAVAVAADDLEVDLLVDGFVLHHRFDLAFKTSVHELAQLLKSIRSNWFGT